MENGILVNGNGNGVTSRPRTPHSNSLSLTEYSTNPSPPSESNGLSKVRGVVPQEFMLPNGYPDVFPHLIFCGMELMDEVSSPHPHQPRLRSRGGNPLDHGHESE